MGNMTPPDFYWDRFVAIIFIYVQTVANAVAGLSSFYLEYAGDEPSAVVETGAVVTAIVLGFIAASWCLNVFISYRG